ncbi:acyl-CoA dehydrogenase family protein [Nocardia sp. NPDC058518]|uniref:acyl-CoA dehydrogenase family protein n=1 Tax=Nocardia sp. NPDC058518 TaxID=3346534 RepID=UPI003668C73B
MNLENVAAEPVLRLTPSEEELAIRDSVRRICAKYPEDHLRQSAERGESLQDVWSDLAEGGFVGLNLPEEWGGGGLGMSGLNAVAEETARAAKGSVMLVVSSAIAGSVLARHATTEQKQRWLRGIAAGTTKLAFAITEPDAGSNAHNLRTELRRDATGYVLNGQKTFISGVESADAILVVARLRDANGQLAQPVLCVVDADAPGVLRQTIKMPFIGPDEQSQLFFDDVVVDADRLIGGETGGMTAVFDGLNPERVIIAALMIGTGLRALDKAAAYARERTVWKTPIGAHQGVAHPLAEAKIELELARLMTQKAAALIDAGAPGAGEAANMAKFAAAEAAIKCVDRSIQTHGGNGFTIEYGISDLWWFSRLMRTAPVSREMILNYVAQHSLDLPRSY